MNEDFVVVQLKPEAGGRAFVAHGTFNLELKDADTARVTRGEWAVYLEPTGVFEEAAGK